MKKIVFASTLAFGLLLTGCGTVTPTNSPSPAPVKTVVSKEETNGPILKPVYYDVFMTNHGYYNIQSRSNKSIVTKVTVHAGDTLILHGEDSAGNPMDLPNYTFLGSDVRQILEVNDVNIGKPDLIINTYKTGTAILSFKTQDTQDPNATTSNLTIEIK